jgi:transcriptional regulator with XRE-family HTH domain
VLTVKEKKMKNTTIAVGERIRSFREIKGLSQIDLEGRSGIKREYISKLETTDLKNPTLRTMEKLAKALGFEVGMLFSDTISKDFDEFKEEIKTSNCLNMKTKIKAVESLLRECKALLAEVNIQ